MTKYKYFVLFLQVSVLYSSISLSTDFIPCTCSHVSKTEMQIVEEGYFTVVGRWAHC